jgi:hypothetical protein
MVGLALVVFVSASQIQVPIDPAALDAMAQRYVAYGLPLPPKNAELEQVAFRSKDVFGKVWVSPYGILALVRPHKEMEDLAFNRPLLNGFCGARAFFKVPEELKTFNRLNVERNSSDAFSEDITLAFAIQVHFRGHDEFATGLLISLGTPPPFRRIAESELDDRLSLNAKVALLAKQYWKNQLVETDGDRSTVLTHLERIFKDEPSVESSSDQTLLEGLRLAVSDRSPGKDRGEQLVNRLCNSHQDLSMWGNGPEILAVVDAGFDAIPALLKHLSDVRVTRAVIHANGGGGFEPVRPPAPSVLTVGALCNSILRAYANQDYEDPGQFAKHAAEWWVEAKSKGEASYFAEQMTHMIYGNAAYVTTRAYTRRHRNTFSKLFLAALAKQYAVADTLVWEIREAPISNQEKQRLCVAAMRSGNPNLETSAERVMNALHLAGRDQELKRIFAALPDHITKPAWNDQNARLSCLALDTDSEDVWQTLTDATRRADVDMRLELIEKTDLFGYPTKNYRPFFRFLGAFMDDGAVTNADGHPTVFSYRIQNEAAGLAAKVLGLPTLGPWSTDDQWKTLRQQVKEEIAAKMGNSDAPS